MINNNPHFGQILLDNPTIYDGVFSTLGPDTKYHLRALSTKARSAVDRFDRRAFNINNHLSPFFFNPIGFRNLQKRTGTIISGTNVFDFFDRRPSGNDMELYVHPGHAKEVGQWLLQREDYTYCQNSCPFEEAVRYDDRALLLIALSTPKTVFSRVGYTSVHQFERLNDEGISRTVFLYLSQYCPLHAILQLHSSKQPLTYKLIHDTQKLVQQHA